MMAEREMCPQFQSPGSGPFFTAVSRSVSMYVGGGVRPSGITIMMRQKYKAGDSNPLSFLLCAALALSLCARACVVRVADGGVVAAVVAARGIAFGVGRAVGVPVTFGVWVGRGRWASGKAKKDMYVCGRSVSQSAGRLVWWVVAGLPPSQLRRQTAARREGNMREVTMSSLGGDVAPGKKRRLPDGNLFDSRSNELFLPSFR